ncbi:MAG: phosphoribosylglycinamide formyltransferase [Deltaproteobacteria bacterium]|jgi:phosphoribosylglycinamide formyltransferase-1|nr:phosphoribosylglycinamide formyltransferase [Deltaproteobacteria bacterium]
MIPNPSMKKLERTAVLISGRGSNLQTLLDKEGCNIRLVCSNKKKAPGLLKAKRSGIPTITFSPFSFSELNSYLLEKKIQKIILLGFMKIIPAEFVNQWQGRIVNLHPSLLPAYPGLDSIENSFKDKAAMGVSLHLVTPEMDEGPLLVQSKVYPKNFSSLTSRQAHWGISCREHFLVRKLADVWG